MLLTSWLRSFPTAFGALRARRVSTRRQNRLEIYLTVDALEDRLCPSLSFAPAVNFDAGDGPRSIVSGDFDRDGDIDLAVTNLNSNAVSILSNDGTGSFSAPTNIVVGDGPIYLTAGDLDGDNDLDLVVGNSRSDNLSLLINDGNGSFSAAANVAVGSFPLGVISGDLDGDGDLDLAVANLRSHTVSVLFNDGNGAFALRTDLAVDQPWGLAAGDLDGDGDLDLAVSKQDSTISVLLNDAAGSFTPGVTFPSDKDGRGAAAELVAADFDRDGDLDLAVTTIFAGINVHANNGDATFVEAASVAGSNFGVVAADLDADGDVDLAVPELFNGERIGVFPNFGGAHIVFDLPAFFEAGDQPVSLTAADLDGNGLLDLAAANFASDNVSVLLNTTVSPTIALSGRVFDDMNNDGSFNSGDTGLAGVTVQLFDESDLATAIATETTDSAGNYTFTGVLPGTYRIAQTQPAGLLDGKETAGDLGGTVDNSQDSNVISGIVVELGDSDAGGYNFADIQPSRIQGLVWEDFNDDAEVNFGETAIEAVAIALSGTDDRGNSVNLNLNSDAQGIFEFIDLRPGTYALSETQPLGFADGKDSLGTVNGVPTGSNAVNDLFSGITLPQPASSAINYNFGERPEADGAVQSGQTATIGFWQNKHGQTLIRSLNGDADSTQLADWLAATFPNMYGTQAGANNLAGMTNNQVAEFYQTLFKRNGKNAPGGPPKVDAQVLASAFAVYVTNETLAGTTATAYGFNVTEHGVGVRTFDVQENGAAFGVANNTSLTVLDLLFAVDSRTDNGLLFDLNGDGVIDASERSLRVMANDVFSSINEE